jgi:mono/diheme cytochrome c family protein/glucose/arabinose dehydrogenase
MRDSSLVLTLVVLALSCSLVAQRGDRPGQKQQMLPDDVVVPAATVRSPAEELATLHVPEGYEVQLFAAEPMVQDPVVATFDVAGRLWVAEFRNYMLDVDASNEGDATGRIVILHDDDHDGRADRSTVFCEELVLPRAVLPLQGGALVITPPNLYWMPDKDGDLVADGRELIMGGFEAGTGNPEHSGNGLTWGFDHRIHLCNDKRLLRRTDDGFVIEAGSGGGQWGLCLDDRGRFYFNYNSDWLRCDLVPNHYGARARAVGGLPLLNHRVVSDAGVWPIRVTPGVNRGYQKGVLKDWRLANRTGVCSPLIYRGGLLPFQGDAFICEPCGNVVRRVVLQEQDGAMRGENAYHKEQREFLASTDERFRPVNLTNGPDGALYIVDMYRGVIQHRNYVTSFLRHQIKKRNLEEAVHRGRIWRVVPEGTGKLEPMPVLVDASEHDLVAALAHASGTVRDQSLQQIVQRKLGSAAPLLKGLLNSTDRPAVRIAAMSALAGLNKLTGNELRRWIRDSDAGVSAFAWQHAGPSLASGDSHLWGAIDRFDSKTPGTIRWHAALAIGDALLAEGGLRDREIARVFAALAALVRAAPGDGMLRAAVATAAHPRIADVLRGLATHEGQSAKVGKQMRQAFVDLARRAMKSRSAEAQQDLLAFASEATELWQQKAVLDGAVGALPKGGRRTGWLVFGGPPAALVALSKHANGGVRSRAQELLGSVRVGGAAMPGAVTNLTSAEKKRVVAGEVLFRGACAACHQLDGSGQRGLAPPLRDSEWVAGPSGRLIRIALHGVKGPIEVDGESWDLEMPGQGHLSDDELAKIFSYLRRAFGHQASCIDKSEVAKVRKVAKRRASAWTAKELLKTK